MCLSFLRRRYLRDISVNGDSLKTALCIFTGPVDNQKDCLKQDGLLLVQSFGLCGEQVREVNTTLSAAYPNLSSPSLVILPVWLGLC